MVMRQATPTTKSCKRLFLLGATGGIGRCVIAHALRRGHDVTAFVRSPATLEATLAAVREPDAGRLVVVKGDPRDGAAIADVLPGHDAVISALGPPGPGATTIHRDAAKATVWAMKAVGVRRLLVVSAAVNFEDEGFLTWLLRNTFLRNIVVDTRAMEAIVSTSGLAFTIVRPPRLTNGPFTDRYVVEPERLPRGGRTVSRADVAHFMVDSVERERHVDEMVGMATGSRRAAEVLSLSR